jgi:hypothetical protein
VCLLQNTISRENIRGLQAFGRERYQTWPGFLSHVVDRLKAQQRGDHQSVVREHKSSFYLQKMSIEAYVCAGLAWCRDDQPRMEDLERFIRHQLKSSSMFEFFPNEGEAYVIFS